MRVSKLSLEKTWVECLRMWKWITQIGLPLTEEDVVALKHLYLTANGHNQHTILNDCYFCDYSSGLCVKCPGTLVDPNFNCMGYMHYEEDPIGFYRLLIKLNKKRLSKKGK